MTSPLQKEFDLHKKIISEESGKINSNFYDDNPLELEKHIELIELAETYMQRFKMAHNLNNKKK